MGYQRARLAGRPRPKAVLDQHDRRCDQPPAGALCAARFDRREHASAGELSGKARQAAELLHRQGELFATSPKTKRGELAGKDRSGAAAYADRARAEGTGYRMDWRAFAAGQRTRRTWIWHGPGSSGEGLAGSQSQDARTSQCLSGERVLAVVEQTLTVLPAFADNAHRPLGKEHSLAASLSHVETRQVANDYTIRFENKLYQIQRADIRRWFARRPGARRTASRWHVGGAIPRSLSGGDRMCASPQSGSAKPAAPRPRKTVQRKSDWMKNFHLGKNDDRRQNLHAVGWAKPARPSSRLLYARPPLQSFTRINLLEKQTLGGYLAGFPEPRA